jgi:septal ring factor EnvC (AmiA/AmiB activator)
MNGQAPMNLRDIQEAFNKMNLALTSQRNVIAQLQAEIGQLRQTQSEVAKLKKEMGEQGARIDGLEAQLEGSEDVDDVEVVESSTN